MSRHYFPGKDISSQLEENIQTPDEEPSSLLEEDHPPTSEETNNQDNELRIGGWLRKRRKEIQLDEVVNKHHKKPRIETPEDDQDAPGVEHQDPGMPRTTSSQDTHLRREEVSIHEKDHDQAHQTPSTLEEEKEVPEGSPTRNPESSQQEDHHHPQPSTNGGEASHILTSCESANDKAGPEGWIEKEPRHTPLVARTSSKTKGVENKTHRSQANMNLALLSCWWKRMEKEAVKDNIIMMEERERIKFTKFFDRKLKSSESSTTCSVGVNGNSSDVLNGRHPVQDEPKEHPPTIANNIKSGQGLPLQGSKRHIPGEMESPAKRQKKFGNTKCENDNPLMATKITNNLQSGILTPRTGNLHSEVKATVDLRRNEIVRPT